VIIARKVLLWPKPGAVSRPGFAPIPGDDSSHTSACRL
jgi:hypothetical protein